MTAEATTASATGFRHFHDQLGSLKEQLLGMSAKAESAHSRWITARPRSRQGPL